ncbi:ABC transporter substrate-binding protein [Pelosinus sp. sgz500959]|uniref:ABC transporter substrate-binding protein n=1 Tax=Pelosinus sp. sgz500959 TaxID=3242472 RepID=UPI00366AEF12
MYNIGILQLTQNLDDAVNGFKQGLAQQEIAANFHYLNADGNIDLLPDLAIALAQQKVDLIFACSTPSAQAAIELVEHIPVVFTPVFDPVGSGLVNSLALPGGKATGVAGMVPADAKITFIQRLLPAARTLGILYHVNDSNSIAEVENFRKLENSTFTLIEIPIHEAEELSNLPDLLPINLDVLFLPIGRIVEENFATIVYYTDTINIPVITSHAPNVPAGALGALVANHHQLGVECAAKAKEILSGTMPASIPVDTVKIPEILLNDFAAQNLGLNLPADLVAEAKEIFE